jgi:hypothetical protein
MPLTIEQGRTGTLTFAPDRVGIDPAAVQSVSWQPQGGQQHIQFTPPDQIEGLTPGVGQAKVTVFLTTDNQKLTWPFTVECVPAGGVAPEGVVPVVIFTPTP